MTHDGVNAKRLSGSEVSAETARVLGRFADTVWKWISNAAIGADPGPPPRLVAAIDASAGKTEAMLRIMIGTVGHPLAACSPLYLVPTTALADELADRIQALGETDLMVFRGRTQPDLDSPGNLMCLLPDIARLQDEVPSMRSTLCRSRDARTGEEIVCPLASKCGYDAQLRNQARLKLANHHFLHVVAEPLMDKRFDYVVIDENCLASVLAESQIEAAPFLAARVVPSGVTIPLSRILKFQAIQAKLAEAIHQAGDAELDITHLRAAGLTGADCATAAAFEIAIRKPTRIRPDMNAEERTEVLAESGCNAVKFASVWERLAEELPMVNRIALYGVRFMRNDDGKMDIFMQWKRPHRFDNKPIIILDADADERILECVFGEIDEFARVRAKFSPHVRVKQIIDTALPKDAFDPYSRTAASIRRAMGWIRKSSEIMHAVARDHGMPTVLSSDAAEDTDLRKRRPLLIGYKAQEEAILSLFAASSLIGDETPEEVSSILEKARNALPFSMSHFGALRGKDCWREASCVVVFGRPLPRVDMVERNARGLCHDIDVDLQFIRPDAEGRLLFPKRLEPICMSDGSRHESPVDYHPDELTNALLRLIRDAELSQAYARGRPIHRTTPLDIVLMTNTPLGYRGLIVDELKTLKDLLISRFELMCIEGVVPYSAAAAAYAYPDLWVNENSVKQAKKNEKLPDASKLHNRKAMFDPAIYGGMWVTVKFDFSLGGRFPDQYAYVGIDRGETEVDVIRRLVYRFPEARNPVILDSLPTNTVEYRGQHIAVMESDYLRMAA